MKLGAHPSLDALCGEYLVGTLRGSARRRFERALAEEPSVSARLHYWEQRLAVTYSERFAVKPAPAVWQRIKRDVALERFSAPWYARMWTWRIWAGVATAALVVLLALPHLERPGGETYATVAVMRGGAPETAITVEMSRDGRALRLRTSRPVQASTAQSFELWLIPAGGAPRSLAVMGSLDTRVALASSLGDRLQRGARLAVSVEPAGGSPTGSPTGPVIAIGDVVS